MTNTLIIALGIAVFLQCSCAELERKIGEVQGKKTAKLCQGQWWVTRIPRFKPIKASDKTAWVTYRNVTQEDFDIDADLKEAVRNKGYTILDDPDKAMFHIIYTLRYFGENDCVDKGFTKAKGLSVRRRADWHYEQAQFMQKNPKTNVREYNLILDVDIAQRKEGLVNREISDDSSSSQASGINGAGTAAGIMSGSFEDNTSEQQSLKEKDNYFWYRNTLVLWAQQIRLTEEEACPSLKIAMLRALPNFLPW